MNQVSLVSLAFKQKGYFYATICEQFVIDAVKTHWRVETVDYVEKMKY